MITILEHFDNIVSIDRPTMIIIGLICSVIVWFSKDYFTSPILAICAWPLFFAASISAYYIFVTLEYFMPSRLDQWLAGMVISATSGTIVGVFLVCGVIKMVDATRQR
jgi:hypothetical protein